MSAIPARTAPKPTTAALALSGGRVTTEFRDALFNGAARAGVSINEFVLKAAAVELARHGAEFPGVFRPGDLPADLQAA